MYKVKMFFGSKYNYVLDEQEYQEFLEYKKWLDTPCCELNDKWCGHEYWPMDKCDICDQETCPEENKHCSCRHIPYDQETLEDRVDDLECDVRQFMTTQKLINKVIEEQISEKE